MFTLHITRSHSTAPTEHENDSHMYPLSSDPELAVERKEQLYQQFVILWEVPEQFCLVHTCSLLLADCPGWQWSCPGHTGISDMQHLQLMGSKDLEGEEMAKKPLNICIPTLHALNFPSLWLQRKLAGLDMMLLLPHAQPIIPLTTVHH